MVGFQLSLTALLTVVFLFQQYLVFPLESTFVGNDIASVVSTVFLPHGLKVMLAVLTGYGCVVPIFTAQFIGGLSFGLDAVDAMQASLLATAAIVAPILLIRLTGFTKVTQGTTNLFWLMVTVGICSSVLNSTLIAVYRGYPLVEAVPVRFLIGDILGVCVIFLIGFALRSYLVRLSLNGIRKNFLKDD